jgi:hypothetical protein
MILEFAVLTFEGRDVALFVVEFREAVKTLADRGLVLLCAPGEKSVKSTRILGVVGLESLDLPPQANTAALKFDNPIAVAGDFLLGLAA